MLGVMTTTKPLLTKRAETLGWLASSPSGFPLRLAVEGRTEKEATDRYFQAVARWESYPDAPIAPGVAGT